MKRYRVVIPSYIDGVLVGHGEYVFKPDDAVVSHNLVEDPLPEEPVAETRTEETKTEVPHTEAAKDTGAPDTEPQEPAAPQD